MKVFIVCCQNGVEGTCYGKYEEAAIVRDKLNKGIPSYFVQRLTMEDSSDDALQFGAAKDFST